MRIISVTNQKGGCGKTTTSVNLAASLATNNRKVLLIDLDPQAHATLGLNIKADTSMYNVLSKLTSKKSNLEDIIKNVSGDFDIAPSSMVLSTLEQELAGEIGRESRLWEILSAFRSSYDYILIDCPPNLGILTINAIRASSEIIIPVEPSRFSLEGLDQLTWIVNLVKDRLSHSVSFKILVANFDSRLRHSFEMLEAIKTKFTGMLFSTIIHVNVKLKEAQNSGLHIFNYDKYSRGAKDYFSLSRELIMQETGGTAAPEVKIPEPAINIREKMRAIVKKEKPALKEVVFTINAPEAKDVFVAGDFNGWKTDDASRMESGDGAWQKRLNLKNGKYHYRFVIDGRWTDDPANELRETNPYGETDSLIEIPQSKG
jgi:chromosome partitioning protein